MYAEKISRVESPLLSSRSESNNRFRETFRDILQRSLTGNSNTHSPKIELTGILIPCFREVRGNWYRYKLGTESDEYFLSMTEELSDLAKGAQWEEVSVKGYFDPGANVFEVEKMTRTEIAEPSQVPTSLGDTFDLDNYERIIDRKGKLEPANEYVAS